MSQKYTVPLVGIHEVAQDTFEATFDASGTNFSAKPGQYISIILDEIETDKVGDKYHEFSVASEAGSGMVSVCFRASESLFKQTLLANKPGDTVEIEGPFGVFVLPEDTTQKITLIAGGVGVTPFLSMIRTYGNREITLIYFNSTEERVAYREELAQLAKNRRNLDVSFVYGDVSEKSLMNYIEADSLYYIAGPVQMVQATQLMLFSLGVQFEKIRSEEFTGY